MKLSEALAAVDEDDEPEEPTLIYTRTLEWKTLLTYYVSGIPVDLVHATATVLFLWLAAEPMLEKMDRIKVKYGIYQL